MRGADRVARALERAGARVVFTVSGNHVMSIFDAVLGTGIRLVHARHEAACVHMADAWARLTGDCGFALVTGGPGHANAVAALYTARAAESPLVLLSGHAPLPELGRGAFQEMEQAALAAPLAKASWTAGPGGLEREVAEAVRIARSGRPGPVHLSLPSDLLDGADDAAFSAPAEPVARAPSAEEVAAVLRVVESARRPLILAGPLLRQPCAGDLLERLGAALGVPAVALESPRGLADPVLGAFPEVLARADLVVLLGKPHDFTLRFAAAPAVDPQARFVVIDPDSDLVARAIREKGERVALTVLAEARASAEALCRAGGRGEPAWREEVEAAIAFRPPGWDALAAAPGRVHPVAFGRAVAAALARRRDPVFVCDGGEIGQWAQSLVSARDRIVNGVAGAIGVAVPFAVGVAAAAPGRPVLAVSGDGAFGFHMAEFDTALRHDLPFVAVIGNDAAWNAEHQIQLRSYGADRAHGCTLLPTRYDRAIEGLGGFGVLVSDPGDLPGALEDAFASGRPACVNVMIEQVAAPTLRR